jgi:alkylated DNA repair dioxygenase AlkB
MESLFDVDFGEEFLAAARRMNALALREVEGLTLVESYITAEGEAELLRRLDEVPWSTEMQRRVYSFGSRYEPGGERLPCEPLPEWVASMAQRLWADGHFAVVPDRALANEYLPGQGISPHSDYLDTGDTVASLSLGSTAVMDFARGGVRLPVFLDRRSLVVMKGVARYDWTHGIARRKSDKVEGFVVPRTRRVSLTFRVSLPG